MAKNKQAMEVLAIIDRGGYEVDGAVVSIDAARRAAVDGGRLYTPDELDALRRNLPTGPPPAIEVVDATTQQVAQTLAAAGGVALLNFASARNPGGGFLNGARAQEEDLCRCSALYPALLPHQEYYQVNRKQKSLLYTDHTIFSPGVPFFKVHGKGELLKQPFIASVITAPAPNSKPFLKNGGKAARLEPCFERRWRNVCAVAQHQRVRTLLLGAWGCGAFGGDALIASRAAKAALKDCGPAFEKVVFAIPASGKGQRSEHNFRVFREQFSA